MVHQTLLNVICRTLIVHHSFFIGFQNLNTYNFQKVEKTSLSLRWERQNEEKLIMQKCD